MDLQRKEYPELLVSLAHARPLRSLTFGRVHFRPLKL